MGAGDEWLAARCAAQAHDACMHGTQLLLLLLHLHLHLPQQQPAGGHAGARAAVLLVREPARSGGVSEERGGGGAVQHGL